MSTQVTRTQFHRSAPSKNPRNTLSLHAGPDSVTSTQQHTLARISILTDQPSILTGKPSHRMQLLITNGDTFKNTRTELRQDTKLATLPPQNTKHVSAKPVAHLSACCSRLCPDATNVGHHRAGITDLAYKSSPEANQGAPLVKFYSPVARKGEGRALLQAHHESAPPTFNAWECGK